MFDFRRCLFCTALECIPGVRCPYRAVDMPCLEPNMLRLIKMDLNCFCYERLKNAFDKVFSRNHRFIIA